MSSFPASTTPSPRTRPRKTAEALLIATEWKEFRDLDWNKIRESMARPLIVDGRNLLSPQHMKALGFEYLSFGRN